MFNSLAEFFREHVEQIRIRQTAYQRQSMLRQLSRHVSGQVFEIFERFTPLVEPLSIDEAFLDITQSLPLFGSPEEIARKIKDQIRATTHVTGSIGVAPNRSLEEHEAVGDFFDNGARRHERVETLVDADDDAGARSSFRLR